MSRTNRREDPRGRVPREHRARLVLVSMGIARNRECGSHSQTNGAGDQRFARIRERTESRNQSQCGRRVRGGRIKYIIDRLKD